MAALTIDVFIDLVCPWCFVGAERLERVLASETKEVLVKHHPFLIDPTTPPEGYNVQERLREKYGADPLQMFATVEAAARESGITLDLTLQPNAYPTLAAHTLARHAEAKGTQRALVSSLFRAYFLQAKNISDANVLALIAAPHGFDPDEALALLRDDAELELTRSDADEAAQGGIRGVPLFIFAGRSVVVGGQSEEVLRSAIHAASAA
jgi:predicted DsbA family dithiol-disulfide isomerase